jgi:hypothetical protein
VLYGHAVALAAHVVKKRVMASAQVVAERFWGVWWAIGLGWVVGMGSGPELIPSGYHALGQHVPN